MNPQKKQMQEGRSNLLDNTLKIPNKEFESFIQTIPAFRNKQTLLPMYVAYEKLEKQENMIKFWADTHYKVFRDFLRRASATVHELNSLYYFDNFRPANFVEVLEELVERRCFLREKDLEKPSSLSILGIGHSLITEEEERLAATSQTGLFSKITSALNPFNIFGSKPQQNARVKKSLADEDIVILTALFKDLVLKINAELPVIFRESLCLIEDTFWTEVERLTKRDVYSKDRNYVIRALVAAKILRREPIPDLPKKIYILIYYVKDDYVSPTEKTEMENRISIEKVMMRFEYIKEGYQKDIKVLEQNDENYRQEALKRIRIKAKQEAKAFLMKSQQCQKRIEDYHSKILVLEKAQTSINDARQNKDLKGVLDMANKIQRDVQIKADDIAEVLEEQKEARENQQEVAAMVKENVGLNEEEDKILEDELDQLEQQMTAGKNVPLKKKVEVSKDKLKEQVNARSDKAEDEEDSLERMLNNQINYN